jgi:hypothetical protein
MYYFSQDPSSVLIFNVLYIKDENQEGDERREKRASSQQEEASGNPERVGLFISFSAIEGRKNQSQAADKSQPFGEYNILRSPRSPEKKQRWEDGEGKGGGKGGLGRWGVIHGENVKHSPSPPLS